MIPTVPIENIVSGWSGNPNDFAAMQRQANLRMQTPDMASYVQLGTQILQQRQRSRSAADSGQPMDFGNMSLASVFDNDWLAKRLSAGSAEGQGI